MSKFNRVVLIGSLLMLAFAASAQVSTNIDSSSSGWTICSACAGGQNLGTGTLTEITSGTPNGHGLDGHLDGPGWANVLYYKSLGATTANYFYYSVWAFVPATSLSGTQVLEYDNYAYTVSPVPVRWMFGSQCVIGGTWWGWNDYTASHGQAGWIPLPSIPCQFTSGKWHHIEWWNHRDPDTSTACSGMPCTYQDKLGFDGTYYSVNLVTPASVLPTNWQSDSGAQFQIGQNAAGTSIDEGIANFNFTALGQ